jgi:hypothetical protein
VTWPGPGRTALVAGLLVTASVLAGCGSQSGDALAKAACGHVNQSIRLYTEAKRADSAAGARTDLARAYAQLRAALPLAAEATSQNGQWVALETTLSESSRVMEGELLAGLQQQCAVADSPNPGEPPQPTEVPTSP